MSDAETPALVILGTAGSHTALPASVWNTKGPSYGVLLAMQVFEYFASSRTLRRLIIVVPCLYSLALQAARHGLGVSVEGPDPTGASFK